MDQKKDAQKEKIGTIIVSLLTLVGVVSTFVHIDYDSIRRICIGVVYLIIYGFVAYYGICGYKKPHGNMLRWIVLVFALSLFVSCQSFLIIVRAISSGIDEELTYDGIEFLKNSVGWFGIYISAVLAGYMAGRLHRIKSNAFIMGFALICMLPRLVLANHYREFYANNIILWIVICVAYILRYRLHKDAGISVESKEKQ